MKNGFILKRANTYAVAVFITVILGYFFSYSEKYWLAIAALSVMQTSVGMSVQQGLQRFLVLLLVVIVGSAAHTLFPVWLCVLLGIGMLCFGMMHGRIFGWFCLILALALLLPLSSQALHLRIYDVTMGAFIGITINTLIFPIRIDVEFRNNIVPIFQLYCQYLVAIENLFFKKNHSEQQANNLKISLENKMQTHSDGFPVWVYESGLGATLQPGHRHFLIMVERLAEILGSLHHCVDHSFQEELIASLEKSVHDFLLEASHIIQALITVLTLNKLEKPVSDLKEEWLVVEQRICEKIPPAFEVMQPDQDYFLLVALLEDLKDLRITLLNLGNALQAACAPSVS